MTVLGISDVSLGYSSPQIPLLVTSLADHYGVQARLLEPDQPERPPRHSLFPRIRIERISTAFHPHSAPGRIQYLNQAVRAIDQLRPEILVVVCTFCLPVLFKLRRRPKLVVYYSVESIPEYGDFDMEMNTHIGGLVDIVVFPEENRASREVDRFGFRNIPKVILYNCSSFRGDMQRVLPPSARNGRIIYFGAIDPARTFANYFLNEKIREMPIDLFGPITGFSPEESLSYVSQLSGAVRYCGHVDADELAGIRRKYSYSIVMYNPVGENEMFAAPNKLFESIAAGVPAIAAPHPQCKMIIRRYQCGLLMGDWTFDEFYGRLRKALNTYGSETYWNMVEGCRRAVESELNWEGQFEKLKAHLK